MRQSETWLKDIFQRTFMAFNKRAKLRHGIIEIQLMHSFDTYGAQLMYVQFPPDLPFITINRINESQTTPHPTQDAMIETPPLSSPLTDRPDC